MIRELCEHISHSCLIFLVTLGDVLLSLSADVLGMFIMQCFDMVVLSFCVSGCSPGVSSEHADELRVFLLVCGLRRVKDPLYLLKVFSGSVSEHYDYHLVYICVGIETQSGNRAARPAETEEGVFILSVRKRYKAFLTVFLPRTRRSRQSRHQLGMKISAVDFQLIENSCESAMRFF